MSAEDCGLAPSSRTSVSRKPAAAALLVKASSAEPTSRSPRWLVASTIPAMPAKATPEIANTMRGEIRTAGRAAPPGLPEAGRLFWGLAELLLRALALLRPAPRTAAGIRVLRDPKHQVVKSNAQIGRLLGDERGGRHAGLSVDL